MIEELKTIAGINDTPEDTNDEIAMLLEEANIPKEELLARFKVNSYIFLAPQQSFIFDVLLCRDIFFVLSHCFVLKLFRTQENVKEKLREDGVLEEEEVEIDEEEEEEEKEEEADEKPSKNTSKENGHKGMKVSTSSIVEVNKKLFEYFSC